MRRQLTIFLVCGFLTAGTFAELSAQTPDAATSETRRSSLFAGSRADFFGSEGGREADRSELKGRSLEGSSPMMDLVSSNKPSVALNDARANNMDIFLITGAIQGMLNLADPGTDTTGADSALIIGDIDTDLDTTVISTVRVSGIYAPRLRFVPSAEDLAAAQTPEAVAKRKEANLARAEALQAELIDKFELPDSANMSLEFHDSIVLVRGRVPSQTLRKRVELYLGFEPEIYHVQNELTVDPTMPLRPETDPSRPVTHSDL